MWKVGGIEIELAVDHQKILGAATEISEKREFFTRRPITQKEERYWDGP